MSTELREKSAVQAISFGLTEAVLRVTSQVIWVLQPCALRILLLLCGEFGGIVCVYTDTTAGGVRRLAPAGPVLRPTVELMWAVWALASARWM